MRARRVALAVLAGALIPGLAAADVGANAPTITGETGLFTLFTGQTIPQGNWSFGLYYNNWDRVVAPVDGIQPPLSSKWDYDWHRLSASLGYGLTDAWEISFMLPYENLDASDNNRIGFVNGKLFQNEIDASGLGNLRVGSKWRLTGGVDEGNSFALNAFVEAPTGDDDEGVSTGDTGWGLGLDWDVNHKWVFNLGYRDPGDPDQGVEVPEEILGGIGYAGSVNDRLDWITELTATLYNGDGPEPDDAYDLITGGRYWFGADGNWAFNFGLRTELNQLGDTDEYCPIGGLLGLTFFPRLGIVEEPPPAPAPPPPPPPAPEPEPAPPPPPPAPPPQPEERVTCFFDSGSARVDNRCKAILDEVALKLKQDSELSAHVIGHSDNRGAEAANQRMSVQRAEAVKTYLVQRHGIDASRITTEGKGSSEPAASNDTAEGRKQNRRAVIIIRVE
jgi:outer membrane protein OmpA-like peptidoglycan-associated protein